MNYFIKFFYDELEKEAGWWRIANVSTGGIDKGHVCPTNPNLSNAIPGIDNKKKLYNGDLPADIMGAALTKIRKVYKREWKRREKPREMRAVFNFVYNAMREEV